MKFFFTICAALLLALNLRAADCPLTFNATDTGWYNAANYHDPENNNFTAGYHVAGAAEFRDWFVFDLPPFNSAVVSAELRLFTFSVESAQGGETLELHHVATPVTTLVAGAGPGLSNVFNDLGDGLIYGARTVAVGEANGYVTIALNSNALAAITAAGGGRFALGGRVSSISPAPTADESLFGYSSGVAPYVQLTVGFAASGTPNIYQQPPATLFPGFGATTNLTVLACGTPPLRYQWFLNNAPLLNRSNSTLPLVNLVTTNNGDYFATVSNALGVSTSGVTHLFVGAFAPVFSFPPYTLDQIIGYAVNFSAQVTAFPEPALQWQFHGTNLPGATNTSLLIANVQPALAGEYTLLASNVAGTATHVYTLLAVPLAVYVPGDYQVSSGDDLYLQSYVSSIVPVTYQWRFNGANIPGANGPALSLFNLTSALAGGYDLVAANSYGARTSAVAVVSVGNFAPQVYYSNPGGDPFTGADYALNLQVSGSRPWSVQWYFNYVPSPGVTNATLIPGATNTSLLLTGLSTNQTGNYFAVVTNAFGSATSSPFTPTVQMQAPLFAGSYSSGEAVAGEATRFAVQVEAGPPAHLQWSVNNVAVPGATNASLLLTNLPPGGASVSLLAVNSLGANLAPFYIDVKTRRSLDQWTWRNSRPQANDLEYLAHGPGRTVAVGEGGSLVTSTNGIDWTVSTLGNLYTVRQLTFGNGLFIAQAARANETDFLLTSADGLNWTPRDAPFVQSGSLQFVNGEFFLTGFDHFGLTYVATSADGQTWQKRAATGFAFDAPGSVVHTNEAYFATGSYGIYRSTDGRHWSFTLPYVYSLKRVRFLNGQFIVTGNYGSLWTSPDGTHWFARQSGTTSDLRGAAYGNGRFTVAGDDGTLLTSTDGVTWSPTDSTTSKHLKDVIFDGAQFVACGNYGALLTSPNGVTWTDRRGGKTKDLYGIIFTNGQFTAVGYGGTILTSPNGATWTSRTSGTSKDLHALTCAAGQYVAVGRDGTVLTSPNSINWTTRATPTTNYLQRVAWGTNRFVAVGENATIVSSTNGINWQLHPVSLPAGTQLEGVAYGRNRFAIVGGYFSSVDFNAHSVMLVSTNGMNWANVSQDTGVILRGVAFGNSSFIAVGNDGAVIYSGNGLAWNFPGFINPYQNLRHLQFGAGRAVAVGNAGAAVSYNTYGWENHASISSQNLHDVAYGLGKFVAVGNAGAIVQSDDARPVFSAPSHAGGALHFNLRGGLEAEYRVEGSTNLSQWDDAAAYTNAGASVSFALGTNGPRRFFRAVYP